MGTNLGFDDEDPWLGKVLGIFAAIINGTSGDMSPTGAPVISGTAKLEQTLTASISGILDPDGTTKADAGDAGYAYTYQWERVDEDGVSGILWGLRVRRRAPTLWALMT